MLRIGVVVIGSFLSISAGAQGADDILRMEVGESWAMEMQESPSTGYSWRIDGAASSNLSILRIKDRGFSRDGDAGQPPAVGAPGVHRWGLEALSEGRARIEFVLERPWEKRPIERHGLDVEAR